MEQLQEDTGHVRLAQGNSSYHEITVTWKQFVKYANAGSAEE